MVLIMIMEKVSKNDNQCSALSCFPLLVWLGWHTPGERRAGPPGHDWCEEAAAEGRDGTLALHHAPGVVLGHSLSQLVSHTSG